MSSAKVLLRSKQQSFTYFAMVCTYFLFAGIACAQAELPSQQAIDTTTLPDTILAASDADSKPLPYYKIATDTYFLYGNIAEVDGKNRGFNGNAGFVVTRDGVVVIDSLGTPKLGPHQVSAFGLKTGARKQKAIPHTGAGLRQKWCQKQESSCPSQKAP